MTKQFWIICKEYSSPDFGPFDTEEQAKTWMKLYILDTESYTIVKK